MNCIEFRRTLLTDPVSLDSEFAEHRTGACARGARRR